MTINNEELDFIQEVLAEDAAERAGKLPFVSNTREFMAAKKAKPDLDARCEALQQLLNDRDQKLDSLEAEKFALEDQVKGLQELGAAPVPPAGDVEVPELMDIPEPSMAYQYRNGWNGCHDEFTPIVTRLTAERDGLAAENAQLRTAGGVDALLADVAANRHEREVVCAHYEQLLVQNTDYKAGQERYEQMIEDLQSELTKARELLLVLREQGLTPVTAAAIRILLANQSAPAAKGGE